MTKFYFTAVSNSAKKKLIGSFEAENEKDARERINKVGMAILSLNLNPPVDWQKALSFSVTEINGQEFAGEIIEESSEQAFDRLNDEFNFKKINYLFAANLSEEEKISARENSVEELTEKRRKEQEKKSDLEKRTVLGSFKTLATLNLNFGEKAPDDAAENARKFSNDGEEDLTKKSAADFPDPAYVQAQPQVPLSPKEEIYALLEDEDVLGVEAKPVNWSEKLQNIKHRSIYFFPNFCRKFSEFYFHFTEIVVPSKGKTRADGWHGMLQFFFPPKGSDEVERLKRIKSLKRRAAFNRFWVSFEEIVDFLAAVFLGYLVLGTISFYVEIPRISILAESTLRDNYLIHFLAGTFIFLRILILLREKFTSWSFWRTMLLFAVGLFAIVFVGLNLL